MKGKPKIGVTISPFTEKQLDALMNSPQLFSSRSDAVDKAIGMLYYAVNHDVLAQCADVSGIEIVGRN